MNEMKNRLIEIGVVPFDAGKSIPTAWPQLE